MPGAKVHDLMADLIDKYFQKHLDLPVEESARLHNEYYQTYGLAIEGLVRHHEIDPLEYNSKVDDALPLEGIIRPRPELKRLLEDIDRSKVKLWLFTNAYVNHAKRVVRLLGIEDQFDGITYCDYSSVPFVCKPHKDAYAKAMKEAGAEKWENCYFVGEWCQCVFIPPIEALLTVPTDDSYNNCIKAKELGWTAAHLVEDDAPVPKSQASQYQIRHLEDLRKVFPQFFKPTS